MAQKRKLLIDGQILQTAAKDRGMGRYSVYLVQAILAEKHGYEEVSIILTKHLSFPKELQDELLAAFPSAKVELLNLWITDGHKIEDTFTHNEKVLNDRVNREEKNGFSVDYLIPSLFQEPLSAVFPAQAKKLLVFYDLIPYLYHRRYEPIIPFENYLKRFKYVFAADKIFAISQTVVDDLHLYLGLPKHKLVRIDGAAIQASSEPQKPSMPIPERYILMPTSDDLRKNNQRAVLGFEEFRIASQKYGHKLVITSTINDKEREHLESFSKHLVFTGNLLDSEVDWLYEHCDAVLFVPEYEGLGLPVLEAVEVNKPIACSAISVFKEISDDSFSYADYENPTSIAEALERALHSKPDTAAYQKIRDYYSWPETAKRFLAGVAVKAQTPHANRPKIALFSPVPDGYSAIGKVVAESHAVMSEYFDIDYYVEDANREVTTRPDFLRYIAPTLPARSFVAKLYANYDAVIYHVGNGDYHLESIKNALYLPGYVILHDTVIREAYRVMGEMKMIQPERVQLEEVLDSKVADGTSQGLTSLLNRQLGVFTHSKYAESAAKKVIRRDVTVSRANLPTSVPEVVVAHLGVPITIGLAGIIADVKGIDIIETIANDTDFNGCQIKLFGFSHATQETINRLNGYPNVSVMTGVTDFEFQTNLTKLDVLVNYRMTYNGETSLSTIEAMRNGVAVIVRDTGWYGELPNTVVTKVQSPEDTVEALRSLVNDPAKIKTMGVKARDHIAEKFDHYQYAEALLALIREPKRGNPNNMLAEKLRTGRVKSLRQYMQELRDQGLS